MPERTQQIDKLLKREIGVLVAKEIYFPSNVLVTVEKAETSSDLSQVNVFVSVFPEASLPVALRILNSQCHNLHQGLNKRLKLRKIPKIRFKAEKQLAKELKIAQILDEIAKDDKIK